MFGLNLTLVPDAPGNVWLLAKVSELFEQPFVRPIQALFRKDLWVGEPAQSVRAL